MCGIAGYIGSTRPSSLTVQSTLALMRNRGPDFQDSVVEENNNTVVALLHSRLSIIDLDSRSHQPFKIGNTILVFNGEIYNYLELRKQLERQGLTFKTNSDTEVLLQMYRRYGTMCVEQFEGMWSLALYDRSKNHLFLSRDRFAEKPLYYMKANGGFYFGSEIKFLGSLAGRMLDVNQRQILRYLVNGYKSLYKQEETFFLGVTELQNASNLIVHHSGDFDIHRYWTPTVRQRSMSLEDAIEGIRSSLLDSVRIRLRADVPLAFCLSGGVDSASLVSIAAKQFGCDVATFSIVDEDERYNEYGNIKATIDDLGCKNTIVHIPKSGALERLRMLVSYHDAPVYTISYYVHSFLSEAIAQQGFKVVFSGTGADELLTGYYDHFILHLHEMRGHLEYGRYLSDWTSHIKRFVRNPHLQNPDLYSQNQSFRDHIYLNNRDFASYLKSDFTEDFIEKQYSNSLLRNRMLNELFHEGTRVILHEDDLNSMLFSIENRSPYLDSRLFDFAYSIPAEHLIKSGYGKYVLREAMAGILNDTVRMDRKKKGFNASIHSIINFSDKKVREYLLDESPIFDIIEKKKIEKALDQKHMENSYSKFMFNFINAKMFLELQKPSTRTEHAKAK